MGVLLDRIIQSFEDNITGLQDLTGEIKPSGFFYIMAPLARHLFNSNSNRTITKTSMRIRKILHPVLIRLAPLFMERKQEFEFPEGNEKERRQARINRPLLNTPVIWCCNHGFKDDVAASLVAAGRHTYILFGSLPVFFNTFDGLSAYLNGVALCNRKVRASRTASMDVAKKILGMGCDLVIFPEGVWNKTQEKLLLDLWPGAVHLAIETGYPIVPIVHYLRDLHKQYKGNMIHTVIGEPIYMDTFTEKEGIQLLRDKMATLFYSLMERYGKTTRKELLNGYQDADTAWENYIRMHTASIKYYDKEIELTADYRRKEIICPADVWKPIAEISNITTENAKMAAYANQIVSREKFRDFQRRY